MSSAVIMGGGGAASGKDRGITAETFETMIKLMDKDGDGTVTKDEFKVAWKMGVDADITDDALSALWKKIDVDGDENLTVGELAAHFGFDQGSENSNEMTDQQILNALALSAAIDAAASKEEKKKAEEEAAEKAKKKVVTRDSTLAFVAVESKKSNASAEESSQIEFLVCCTLGDVTSTDPERPTVLKSLDKAKAAETKFRVRVEDEKGAMALHMLARQKVKADSAEGAGIKKTDFTTCFKTYIEISQAEIKAELAKADKERAPSLYKDVNHQDKAGKTPLAMAVEHKNVLMVELLFGLDRLDRPDSLLVNQNGWGIMHTAVQSNDLDLIKTLVLKISSTARVKTLVTLKDKNDRDPLHIAAYRCEEDIVNYLLHNGAEPLNQDSAGNRPSALAKKSNRHKSRELLEQMETVEIERRRSKELPGAPAPADTAVARARRRSKSVELAAPPPTAAPAAAAAAPSASAPAASTPGP